MLVIRLRRVGKKNKPTYRVVVAEHSNPVNGKFTADLGFYNPHTKKTGLNTKEVETWLNKGAKPSNTVAKVLSREKIKHPLITVTEKHRRPKKEQPAPTVKEAAPQAEAETAETEQPANEESADSEERAEEVVAEASDQPADQA